MIGDTHIAQCSILGWPAFLHYGTEITDGAIVENTWLQGCRRVDSLTEFARGRPIWVRPSDATMEERIESVRRAESKIGCRDYSLLWNNCEHHANWCASGVAFSQQVIEGLRKILGAAFTLVGACLAWAGLVLVSTALDS
jgi:hypothetical protein